MFLTIQKKLLFQDFSCCLIYILGDCFVADWPLTSIAVTKSSWRQGENGTRYYVLYKKQNVCVEWDKRQAMRKSGRRLVSMRSSCVSLELYKSCVRGRPRRCGPSRFWCRRCSPPVVQSSHRSLKGKPPECTGAPSSQVRHIKLYRLANFLGDREKFIVISPFILKN